MVAFNSGKAIVAVVFGLCSAVLAQDPFISYNTTIPIGQAGFVRWDTNTFSSPVNLWLQQLAPNASAPQVPLDYSNTKGFFLWSAGTNLLPGQYFYQLQKVGGTGIIYKSNPLMVVCSECEVPSQPPVNSDATDTGGTTTPTATGQTNTSGGGSKLSAGAAAGIGVGGSLFLVGIIALIFFLFRRSRKRRQAQFSQPPNNMSQTKQYPSSITPASPPPHFSSPYSQPQDPKSGFPPPSPATLNPTSPHRHPSHELDSNHGTASPFQTGYAPSGGHMTPNRMSSPGTAGIVAPQPHSPDPNQYPYQRPGGSGYSQVSPPIGGATSASARTPGSYHETSSYGFPAASDQSPGHDEAYGQNAHGRHGSATSPGAQQGYARRPVGSPR